MIQNEYDYIIAGGGLAGLSLAFYLNESRLRDKRMLIVDRAAKNTNDHTWCFWEKEKSTFEEIVFHRWKTLYFYGTSNFTKLLDFGAYQYKMIRAADFYRFIFSRLETNPQIEFLQAEIVSIDNRTVKTGAGDFTARETVFDSFTRKTYDNPKYQNLWQHFLGWTIETPGDIFDPQQATLFDFRIEQKNECRFVYILPFSARKALIEFTVFSDNTLEKSEYEFYLDEYIREILGIKNYRVTDTEVGVIPMSDEPHTEAPANGVTRIGTAGGYVKPSTGYSFHRTQRRLKALVEKLEAQNPEIKDSKQKAPISGGRSGAWKQYLDSVLLNVLQTKKQPAADVFTHLFRDNPTQRVLRFLDEESNIFEDLRIMQSVPLLPFSKAAAETVLRKINLSDADSTFE